MRKQYVVLAGLVLGLAFNLHAQLTLIGGGVDTPISSAPDSIVAVTADAYGLEPVGLESLPTFAGTFWIAQPNNVTPPFPGLPPQFWNCPVWVLDEENKIFLVDASGGEISVNSRRLGNLSVTVTTEQVAAAVEAQGNKLADLIERIQDAQMMREMSLMFGLDAPAFEEGGSYSPDSPAYASAADYGTGLWVQPLGMTNNILVGNGMNTEADVMYEIESRTNLLQMDWQSEGFIFGSEMTNWTPLSVAANGRPTLFLRLKSWADDGSGLPLWWQQQYFGTNGVDPYANPAGDGYDNLEKFQLGLNPNAFVAPPAPGNFLALISTNGTNVLLSWNAAQGAVTGYRISRGVYNPSANNYTFSTIGTVSANTRTLVDVGAVHNYQELVNNLYDLTADYPGNHTSETAETFIWGESPPSDSPTDPSLSLSVQLVRNETGRWQLMFSGLTPNMQTIALDWQIWDYFYDFGPFDASYLGYPFSTTTNIPVSRLTNGVYVIPDSMVVSALLLGDVSGTFNGWTTDTGVAVMVQAVSTTGGYGNQIMAGLLPNDQPAFADGRQCLKQNLLFALRAAGVNQPYVYLDGATDTNYAESSFLHFAIMEKGYGNYHRSYLANDNLWPFTANYSRHQNLYDPGYTGAADFVWPGNLVTNPTPAILGIGDPYWIKQPINPTSATGINPVTGFPFPNYCIYPDMPAYTNGGNLYLPSGAHNLYGLAVQTILVNINSFATVAPGSSIAMANVNVYYSQAATPSLKLTNYYFAPVNSPGTSTPNENPINQPAPIPTLAGFANTNQTGIMVASVGTPITVGGWAKLVDSNSR